MVKVSMISIYYPNISKIEEKLAKGLVELPTLEVGDTILIGKWKNRRAIIKGFGKDENNQPIVKTDKGDVQMFKFRIPKLMK